MAERYVKVTNITTMRQYREAGRKMRIVQMGPDGKVPIAWWFEPAAKARKRTAEQKTFINGIQRDLAKAQAKAPRRKPTPQPRITNKRSK